MKKTISITVITVLFVLCLIGNMGTTYAAGTPTFTATAETAADSAGKIQTVGQAKEVTVYFGVKDFKNFESSKKKGINVFRAALDYDENVFEGIEISLNSNNSFAGFITKTKSGEDPMVAQNSWTSPTYNPENKELVLDNSKFINEKQHVVKVTLKVKANAPKGNTNISLKDIEASDSAIDIYPSNSGQKVSAPVEVVGGVGPVVDFDPENGTARIRILPDTTVAELKALVPEYKEHNVKNSAGTVLADTDLVPTGATTTDGNYTYSIIAVGDLNSDGKMSAVDLSQISEFSSGNLKTLNDDQKRAADVKWDAKFTATDVSQSKSLVVGLGDPRADVWYGTGEATSTPVEPNN